MSPMLWNYFVNKENVPRLQSANNFVRSSKRFISIESDRMVEWENSDDWEITKQRFVAHTSNTVSNKFLKERLNTRLYDYWALFSMYMNILWFMIWYVSIIVQTKPWTRKDIYIHDFCCKYVLHFEIRIRTLFFSQNICFKHVYREFAHMKISINNKIWVTAV